MCFACGYEWPEGGAAAPPAPAPSSTTSSTVTAGPAPTPPAPPVQHGPSPSQSFKIQSPTSFPTASVVPRMATPAPQTPLEDALPPDEIDLDVDFDERRPSGAFGAGAAAFGATPPPAFPSPSGSFGKPPPAFPSPSGSFSAGGSAFGAPPPPAFPTPSGSFGQPAFGTAPPAFPTPSASFGQPAFGAPPPAFPSSVPEPAPPRAPTPPAAADPWNTPVAAAAPPERPASVSHLAPAQPSWGSNPTVQVSASVAASLLQGIAIPPPAPAAPPAGLSDLFDGLTQPPPAAPTAGDVVDANNDDLNFTLEPGADVTSTPFDAVEPAGVEAERPASSKSVPIDFADDVVDAPVDAAPEPPAPVGIGAGFAELDVADFDAPIAAPSAAPTPAPAPAPAAFDPFAASPAPVSEPAPGIDESSFAGIDAELDAEGPVDVGGIPDADAPLDVGFDAGLDVGLDGEAAFDALGDFEELGEAPPLDDEANQRALAELDAEIAALDGGLSTGLSTGSPSAPVVETARAATLSARLGQLAESLEEGGRIADAALLYEVQAVLSASGR